MKSAEEDFAETFAAYVLHGATFRSAVRGDSQSSSDLSRNMDEASVRSAPAPFKVWEFMKFKGSCALQMSDRGFLKALFFLPKGQYAYCVAPTKSDVVWNDFFIGSDDEPYSVDFVPPLNQGTLFVRNKDIGQEESGEIEAGPDHFMLWTNRSS